MKQTVKQLAKSWRLPIDIDFCQQCGRGAECVELPLTDPDEGIVYEYQCFECAALTLEDD